MRYLLLLLAVFWGDQKLKKKVDEERVLHEETPILKGKITVNKYYNEGAMLNFLKDRPTLLFLISTVLLICFTIYYLFFLMKKGSGILKFAGSLILGGAYSNYYDRIKHGYVIDYFSIKGIKNVVFNIGDLGIFAGSFIYLIYSLINQD